ARNEVPPGGVTAAPGAGIHPVVHSPRAVGALALERIVLAPRLGPAAPGAVAHGVLYPSPTAPITAGIHPKSLGRVERPLAGIALLVDVRPAPGAVAELVRHDPAAVIALRTGEAVAVAPKKRTGAVGAVAPVAVQLVTAH